MSDADFYNSFAYCNILNNLIYREYSIAINSAAIQLATHANGIAKKTNDAKNKNHEGKPYNIWQLLARVLIHLYIQCNLDILNTVLRYLTY